MLELHLPWLELSIVLSLIGALCVSFVADHEKARKWTIGISFLVLLCTLCAWEDFYTLHTFEAHDHWDLTSNLLGKNSIVIDELNAPLIPLTGLVFFLTFLSTLRTKIRRFPFRLNLLSLGILLAIFSCRSPWLLCVLLTLHCIPPGVEILSRGRPVRVFVIHMTLFILLMIAGLTLVSYAASDSPIAICGIGLLIASILVRSGCVPVHCWMTDLFENASLGTALLFLTPMTGAYAAVRIVLPIAPAWALQTISMISLITSIYATGMALVQKEARRFYAYLFLSHSSLVLVGLEVVNVIGLSGALCVWISVCLALTGFGLTLRALESRTGRLSLEDYHGLYDHVPDLAVFFLLTGLAGIGFPGTIGFIGIELLVEGVVHLSPYVGIIVVFAAALNGIAFMHAYLRLFTGTTHTASISLKARLHERIAILVLSILIIGGGIYPQPGVQSRSHAAVELLDRRNLSYESESNNIEPTTHVQNKIADHEEKESNQ